MRNHSSVSMHDESSTETAHHGYFSRRAVASVVAFAAGAVLIGASQAAADVPASSSSTYPATATLDGRTAMELGNHAYPDLFLEGTEIRVLCQAAGSEAYGSRVWDIAATEIDSPAGGRPVLLPDRYVRTGFDGFAPELPRCTDSDLASATSPQKMVSFEVDDSSPCESPDPGSIPGPWGGKWRWVPWGGHSPAQEFGDAVLRNVCLVGEDVRSVVEKYVVPAIEACVGTGGAQHVQNFVLKGRRASVPEVVYGCVAGTLGELGVKIYLVN